MIITHNSILQAVNSLFKKNQVAGYFMLLCYNPVVKRELMDILACPVCKGELELTVKEENEKEIVSGSLFCQKCRLTYSIEDAIPNLLPLDQTD